MLFNGFHLVKTIQFANIRTLGNPVQFASVYNARNVDELIFIDMMASIEKREPEYERIEEVVKECFMPLTIGGGIHTMAHVDKLFRIGADKVAINTGALENPEFISAIAKKYGGQGVVVSVDAKRVSGEFYVFTQRGTKNTGISVTTWLRTVASLGAGEILLNSIDNDGTLSGYDLELIQLAGSTVSLPIIALGGAGKVQDLIDAIKIGHADAVALASMFHYSGHTANSIKERMLADGIPVRIIKKNDHEKI